MTELIAILTGLAGFAAGRWWERHARQVKPRRRTDQGGMVLRAFDVGGMASTTNHAKIVSTSPPPLTRPEEWRLAITSFAFHGNMVGFSCRAMSGAGICRRAAWEAYSGLLRDAGVVVRVNRVETAWAPSWGYPRFRVSLRRGLLTLPYPLDTAPPPLLVGVATQPAQHSTGGTDGTREA